MDDKYILPLILMSMADAHKFGNENAALQPNLDAVSDAAWHKPCKIVLVRE